MSIRVWRVACVAGLIAFGGVAPTSAQQRIEVSGVVIEVGTGAPVAGAEVRVAGGEGGVLTSADGTWRMSLPARPHELVVEHLAFASENVEVPADGHGPLRVELTPRPVPLDEVVVTASRRLQPLKDVPVATEVLPREDIARTGAADLSAVLVERTGVSLQGGHPVGAGVMLQGLGSERVLILVDGQPFIGRISGALDISRIPTAMVERVEVVKGPQSTLYGSEAMGGVVNVITRSPERGIWRGGLQATGGSQGRMDLTGNLMSGTGPAAYSLDLGRRTIELVPGHSGDAGTFATRWDGNARVRWEVKPDFSVNAGTLLLDERQRWKSGVLYNFTDNVQWGTRLGAEYSHGTHRFTPTLYATEFHHLSRRSTLPQPIASEDDETEVQRLLEAELLYAYTGDGLTLDGGVEASRESIHSGRVSGGDRALHTLEPFVQATWMGDAWSVVPGARLSWSEQWGMHFTPRIAGMVRPTEQLALRASIGQGFRAPSFKELYMVFLNTAPGAGYRVEGNEALEPETSTNLSGSIEWSGERLYSRVQVFYNRFDDFIETRELPADGGLSVYTYGNIDDGETYGSEVELGATWDAVRAEVGYAWLQARDRRSGMTLLGRPTHSMRASMGYTLPFGLSANVSGTYAGATPTSRADDGSLIERDALTRIDVRAAQKLPNGLELSAGIDNLLDATLAGHPGYLGRQLYLSLGWSGTHG